MDTGIVIICEYNERALIKIIFDMNIKKVKFNAREVYTSNNAFRGALTRGSTTTHVCIHKGALSL